jgi:hypothetical protein
MSKPEPGEAAEELYEQGFKSPMPIDRQGFQTFYAS